MSFILCSTLSDDEFATLGSLNDQSYNMDNYLWLLGILDERESVSAASDRLKAYFRSAGLIIEETNEPKSNIFAGCSLDEAENIFRPTEGPRGPKGEKGDKGDTGDAGTNGTNGEDGEDGEPGVVMSLMETTPFSIVIEGASSNPSRASSPTFELATKWRLGDRLFMQWIYKQASGVGAVAGSGLYLWKLPTGLSMDPAKIKYNTNRDLAMCVGRGEFNTPGSLTLPIKLYAYDATHIAAYYQSAGAYSQAIDDGVGFASGDWAMDFEVDMPILGWTASN